MTATESPKAGARTQHTAGPWTAREGRNDQFVIEAPGSKPGLIVQVATVYETTVMRDETERREADARLIAAAPDLLEACREALDALQGSKYETDKRLFAAIAKAEGK